MRSLSKLISKTNQDTALCYMDKMITYEMLADKMMSYSKKINDMPVEAIIILTPEDPLSFIYIFLGCLLAERPVAVFSSTWTEKEETLRKQFLGKSLELNQDGDIIWENEDNHIYHHQDTAVLLFTSGSSGLPKVVQLSKQNIAANTRAVIDSLNFNSVNDQLLFLPLSYSYGLLGQLLPALYQGIASVILNNFGQIKVLCDSNNIPRMWSGTPSHWEALIKMAPFFPSAFKQITHVISAGAPLSLQLRKNLKRVFSNAVIYNNYGLTEASPRVLSFSSKDPQFFLGGVGYPVGDWKIKLTSRGELMLKGSQVMLGYLDKDKKNLDKNKLKEGWLYTGDMAKIDSHGLVDILGREDNIYNIAGEKISIIEIEDAIKNFSYIKEAVVVAKEDSLYGVFFIAIISTNDIAIDVVTEKLMVDLGMILSMQKIPKEIHVVGELPKNNNGKIDRPFLMAKYN